MKALKLKESISLVEAMDALSSLSEVESSTVSLKRGSAHLEKWLDPANREANEDTLKNAFYAIHCYLKQNVDKDHHVFKDPEFYKSIVAILKITYSAVSRVVRFTDLFKKDSSVKSLSDVKEYQDLQRYIQKVIFLHLRTEDVKEIKEKSAEHVEEKSVRDLEEVKEDLHYELFYMKNEKKVPYYGTESIRNLKLIYDATEVEEKASADLAKLRLLEAKDYQQRAFDILKEVSHLTEEFYKDSVKAKGPGLASSLKKAFMALMLAASPRNLPDKTTLPKTAIEHFADFRTYLREALNSIEYQEGSSSNRKSYSPSFVSLAHKLCYYYFLSISIQKEMVAFLRGLIEVKNKNLPIMDLLLSENQALRGVLEKHVNGPLKKVIHAFLHGEIDLGWDPLAQKNAPSHIFTVFMKNEEIAVLRMAAPLKQSSVDQAEIVEEFSSFLTGCLLPKKEKMLFIDLQDSTSLDEHARTDALQSFAQHEEIQKTLSILRLAKQTDFYFQEDVYKEQSDAFEFISHLKEQIQGGSISGFLFPKELPPKALLEFLMTASLFVHDVFFENKKKLDVRERQDFIEIIYFLISLKAIEVIQPKYMAFISKDGLDTAIAANAGFFFCLKNLLKEDFSSEKDRDFLLWLLYAPILFLRERAIHKEDLQRTVHFMETFQNGLVKNRDKLKKGFESLYDKSCFKSVEIKEGD